MKVETYACDVCGTQKKAANRWWKVYKVAQLIGTETVENAPLLGLLITAWDAVPEGMRLKETTAHLCGEGCVTQYISKNLFQTDTGTAK